MFRARRLLLAATCLFGMGSASQGEEVAEEIFLVRHHGYALLDAKGNEQQRLETRANGAGRISPDGQWVAYGGGVQNPPYGTMIIESLGQPKERDVVPLIWGQSGTTFMPIWASDSNRILICERGPTQDGHHETVHRIYNLASKEFHDFKVPEGFLVDDWSADGSRLLARTMTKPRLAWLNIEGKQEPEFLTSEREIAYLGRLSPDDRSILCMLRPEKGTDPLLTVIDLRSDERTTLDERGATYCHCWSADGSTIAYTWQKRVTDFENKVSVRRSWSPAIAMAATKGPLRAASIFRRPIQPAGQASFSSSKSLIGTDGFLSNEWHSVKLERAFSLIVR